MKKITSWIVCAAGVILFLQACDKKDQLPFYKNGDAPVLSSSVSSVAATPADSNNVVLSFSWTDPKYGTDAKTVKYVLEIDSAGKNFSNAARRTVAGELKTDFTGKELNEILIGFGFKSGTQYSIDARLTSSYANSNDMYQSNTVSLQATPYKVPPKIPVPAELIMVGDATIGAWDNPAADPAQAIAQKFALLDETTYGGVFFLYGGGQYLMLPKSGNWDHKFGGESITGGDLLVDGAVPGSNTPAPATDGWYKIIVDFQTGKYQVTPYTQVNGLPSVLVAVGGATPGGWDNNVDNTQKFTRLNSVEFTQTIDLKKDDAYLMIPVPGNWDKKFGVVDKSDPAAKLGGTIVPNGQDIPSPSEAGNYKIDANFATETYKVTKQ